MSHPEDLLSRRKLLRHGGAWALAGLPPLAGAREDHARHAPPTAQGSSEIRVNLPAVDLADHRGRKSSFAGVLADGRAVMLNFIYTSCQSVCPLMARSFADVQARLGAELSALHMVSVTIDPEHDSVSRLAEYARSLAAGPHWDFYTGSLADCTAVQRAFDAYRGDKMNHVPATYLQGPGSATWIRLQGLASPTRIAQAYVDLLARCKSRDDANLPRS